MALLTVLIRFNDKSVSSSLLGYSVGPTTEASHILMRMDVLRNTADLLTA